MISFSPHFRPAQYHCSRHRPDTTTPEKDERARARSRSSRCTRHGRNRSIANKRTDECLRDDIVDIAERAKCRVVCRHPRRGEDTWIVIVDQRGPLAASHDEKKKKKNTLSTGLDDKFDDKDRARHRDELKNRRRARSLIVDSAAKVETRVANSSRPRDPWISRFANVSTRREHFSDVNTIDGTARARDICSVFDVWRPTSPARPLNFYRICRAIVKCSSTRRRGHPENEFNQDRKPFRSFDRRVRSFARSFVYLPCFSSSTKSGPSPSGSVKKKQKRDTRERFEFVFARAAARNRSERRDKSEPSGVINSGQCLVIASDSEISTSRIRSTSVSPRKTLHLPAASASLLLREICFAPLFVKKPTNSR